MAWYPRAVRKQLTVPNRAKPSGRISMPSPVRVNLHTAVSNSYSLAWDETSGRQGYFNTTGAGGVFSHFYIRRDGVVEQMQDTAYRAACDLDGNPDTISIETWDGYRTGFEGYWKSDSDVPPLNPAQAEAMVDLLRWILDAHPKIPAKLAVSNRRGPESHGFSYHRLGAPGYALYTQAEGGLLYTNSYKKGCPGTRKIGQMAGILAAATNQSEEDDMAMTPTERAALIADIAEAARAKIFEQRMTGPGIDSDAKPTMHDYLVQLPARTGAAVHQQWLGSSGPTIGIAVQSTYSIVQALADRAGVDVDEAAMAQQVAAIVAPVVRDAVVAAATAGGSPEAVADAVLAKLGGTFTSAAD